jgi:penicillin-binding protein 2
VGDEKGSGGIEETMDRYLRGQPGSKRVAKDEKGVVTGTFDPIAPGYGATVRLTLDANIQLLVENTLRQIGRGAGVVMNVDTGEVLAMASVPDYDPSAFIPSITAKRLADYDGNKLSPFTNRAMTGFAPGSTFKLPTAISGAIEGMAGQVFSCDGGVAYGNHTIHCWIAKKGGSHGSLTLPMAIKQSCNPYFNKLANAIKPAGMMTGFQMMGFGKPTGIELPNEEGGILPGTKDWLARKKESYLTPVNNAFLSIGQGDAMATPLQLCAMVSCIANGGKYYTPRIVKKVVSGDGQRVIIDDIPKLKVDLLQNGVKAKDMDLIRKGMWLAVNEPGGTAGRVKIPNIEVAAKTGTAQTMDNGKPSHNSWVVSFAPFDKPKYAVCLLVQNGGSGGGVCGPLVNMIYQGIFAQEEGMKLPLRPQTEFGGNTNRYEPEDIKLPENVLAAIEATPADVGETGDESDATPKENAPALAPGTAPRPTITQEADEEGQVPKAKPVTAPKAKPVRGR